MGHKTQFDLAIICAEEDLALIWHECLAQFAAHSIANGNVLQIRIAARKSAGSCNRLIELAVDAMRTGIDFLWQGFDVGAQQLLVAAIAQDAVDEFEVLGIVETTLELHEHILGRAAVLGLRVETQLVEYHLSHYLGRKRIERMAHDFGQALLQSFLLLLQDCLRLSQRTDIEAHTRQLHVGEDTHKGHLDFGEELEQVLLLQHGTELLRQLISHVTVFTTILGNLFDRALTHRLRLLIFVSSIHHCKKVEVCLSSLLLFASVDECTRRDGLVAQIDLRKIVHVVRLFRLEQIVGNHRVEERIRHLDTIALQNGIVILRILRYLKGRVVLKDGSQLLDNGFRRVLIGGHGHIPSLMIGHGKRNAHELCIDDVQTRCLGIECPFGCPEELRNQVLALGRSVSDDVIGLDVANSPKSLGNSGDFSGKSWRGGAVSIAVL